MVGPGARAGFAVFAALAVDEMVDARSGVDPHCESAQAVWILTGGEDDDGVLQHIGNCLVIDRSIVEHNGQEGL